MAALWFAWEEPLAKVPASVIGDVKPRLTLKEKMAPGWKPAAE